jgi:hypothetical protein
MKSVQISIETARMLYKSETPELRQLALDNFSKQELEGVALRDYYEIATGKECFYVTIHSDVNDPRLISTTHQGRDDIFSFKTEAMAKRALAMAQLEWLIDDANGEWKPDWKNDQIDKYCIRTEVGSILFVSHQTSSCFLAFRSSEIREAFYNKHKQLIHDYLMIP